MFDTTPAGNNHILEDELQKLNWEMEKHFNLNVVMHVDKHNVPVAVELEYVSYE